MLGQLSNLGTFRYTGGHQRCVSNFCTECSELIGKKGDMALIQEEVRKLEDNHADRCQKVIEDSEVNFDRR